MADPILPNDAMLRKQRQLAERLRPAHAVVQARITGAERIKDRTYRMRLRRDALARLGGACHVCGCDIPEALEFCHIEPTYRSRLTSRDCAEKTYRAVVAGELDGKVELKCATCHTIETRLKGDHGGRRNHERYATAAQMVGQSVFSGPS